jgi:hypothetical protein
MAVTVENAAAQTIYLKFSVAMMVVVAKAA